MQKIYPAFSTLSWGSTLREVYKDKSLVYKMFEKKKKVRPKYKHLMYNSDGIEDQWE